MNIEPDSRDAIPDSTSSPFLDAARCRRQGRPPVWIMRQAGRYLPQYRAIRERHTFVEMCKTPDLAFEVSMQPIREFDLDAAIVFYDILFLAEAMGAPLEYTERGPVFHRSVRSAEDVAALDVADAGSAAEPVAETLRRLREALPPETAVLGFAGAPFTMAAYLVEGDFRRSGNHVRRMMHEAPETLRELLDRLATATADYLKAQIEAGADAVQLFDTWGGLLGAEDYEQFALPFQRKIFDALAPLGVPTILYVNGCGHLLEGMRRTGASVLSVDWRISLPEVRARVGADIALQGNLDPATLFAAPDAVREKTRALLESIDGDPACIINLGHGILPETPVESVRALVETVKAWGA